MRNPEPKRQTDKYKIKPWEKYIFNLSLQRGIFPENLKIAEVSPIYKKDEEFLLTNYRPISVLPCFSKLLERIMYNRLFKYLFRE